MKGTDQNVVVAVKPQILDANGQPMERPQAELPDIDWQKDINAEILIHTQGHWFEIVGIVSQGIVCTWRGPTKKRKHKTPKEK